LFFGVDAESSGFEGEGVFGVDKAVAAFLLSEVVVGLGSSVRNHLVDVLGSAFEVG